MENRNEIHTLTDVALVEMWIESGVLNLTALTQSFRDHMPKTCFAALQGSLLIDDGTTEWNDCNLMQEIDERP